MGDTRFGVLSGIAVVLLLGACGGDDDGPGAAGASGAEAGRDGGAGRGVCTSDGACEQAVELEPAQHVDGEIDYGELPPAGGPHDPCWDDYGVHDAPLAPERFVHNLEHGAVVLLYACPDGCAEELEALEGFVEERPWAILTEYGSMPTRFAILAWGYRLMSDELDLAAFGAFYDAHADRAPESVPSGKPAGCP